MKAYWIAIIALFPLACSPSSPSAAQQDLDLSASAADATTLPFSSGVKAILEDSQGNLWIGSHEEGVCRYDGTSFTCFTISDGLSSNQVRTIQEDHKGVIWFDCGDAGVSSYDGTRMMAHRAADWLTVTSRWRKAPNDLWFSAGNREGIHRHDGRTLEYLAFPQQEVTNPQSVYHVTSIAHGQQDKLWIGTYAGVLGYDGRAFEVINDAALGYKRTGDLLHVRSVFEDTKGRLWIGNNGIGVLLRQDGQTINFSAQMGLIHPNSTGRGDRSPAGTLEHVFAIAEDSRGHIWFSDRDTGIWEYDGTAMVNYSTEQGWEATQFPMSLYFSPSGALWLGAMDGKVYQREGTAFRQRF